MTRPGKNLYGFLNHKAVFLAAAFAIPALYLNLGMIPLKGDESIRAVVTLEMMLSGDYVTPTLNGELYLNKPPLYNWILAGFFRLFHDNSEFMVRFPTTLFLIMYCIIIYLVVKKQLGKQLAILSSMAFLTCGRILFWDSYLGLIDIFYSMLMFINFMVIWRFYRKGSLVKLFLISWFICSAGFLLKGIPTLAFQGITLIVIAIQKKDFRPLFSAGHFAGILLFVVITGTYYYLYSKRNPGYLDHALLRLVTESTDKSAIGNGFSKTAIHFFTFPFELISHFMPWMLMVVLLFHKKIFSRILRNEFIKYCMLVFLGNILIYWFSPTTYPRYLLMLMPMAFIVLIYAGKMHALAHTMNFRLTRGLILSFIAGLSLSAVLLPVVFSKQIPVNHLFLKSAVIAALLGLILILSKSSLKQAGMIYIMVVVLLAGRISFNFFLQPYRESQDWLTACRKDAIELSRGTKDHAMYFLSDTLTIHNVYYLTRERNEILKRGTEPDKQSYFIIDDTSRYQGFRKEYPMRVPFHYKTFYAGKFEITKQ